MFLIAAQAAGRLAAAGVFLCRKRLRPGGQTVVVLWMPST